MTDTLLPDAIILNGPSSSGKTSIARQLQERLPALFLNFSIDSILYQLPPSDLSRMMAGRKIERAGYSYGRLVRGHHAAAAALLAEGNRLILDNALVRSEWKSDLEDRLQGYRLFWVGVSCGLPELARRERERGDRAMGTAEREALIVHEGLTYDLVIDTTSIGPEPAAALVLEALAAQGR